MKRSIWLSGLLITVLFACEKENAQPYAELPATVRTLTNAEHCMCDPRIALYKWKGQLLYVHYFAGPMCNTRTSFFDEEGNEMELDADERRNFGEEARRIKIVWTCGE